MKNAKYEEKKIIKVKFDKVNSNK